VPGANVSSDSKLDTAIVASAVGGATRIVIAGTFAAAILAASVRSASSSQSGIGSAAVARVPHAREP
jgi:hypothetical protein